MFRTLATLLSKLAPLLVFLIGLGIWEFVVVTWEIHKVILPGPREVGRAFYEERWVLIKGAWVTLQSASLGLFWSALVGGIFALLFSQSRSLRASLYPYVIFLQTVPIVAIAPLLILWFGNEFKTVVLVATIISIFPVISNSTSGLLSVDPTLVDLFRINRASRWQTLCKLRIPAAVPYFVLGLRISCGLAVIGAIVGEFFVGDRGAYEGLGTIITARQGNLRTASVIAAVFTCTLLGLLLLGFLRFLDRFLLKRWTQNSF